MFFLFFFKIYIHEFDGIIWNGIMILLTFLLTTCETGASLYAKLKCCWLFCFRSCGTNEFNFGSNSWKSFSLNT